MNVTKLASEIYTACYQYRRCDGRIKVSKRDDGHFDIYHSYGTDVIAYQGDSAKEESDRVIFTIALSEINWNRPLKKYIIQELKEVKKEEIEKRESLAAVAVD